jgi:hypothetical protein
MAYGLEIWNAAGVKTLSVTDRLARYHGTFTVTIASGGTASLSVPGYALDGTWFYFIPGACRDGVVVTPAADGFSFSHNGLGGTIAGSYTLRIWRG